ncbi:MAG: tetratricopeptide repeat-containing sensor histidine kinase, partial [Cyclobacteriaceae bacterium]|nr:tetratricopeptide repeat-containing sensor histidine kinase [Cyclobacteriaceae bacterium]
KLIETHELDPVEEMEAYYWLSAYSTSPDDELTYGKQLLELAKASENQEYFIRANERIGVAHRLMGNLGKALAYLFESANMASKDPSMEPILIEIYAEISTCYTQNNDAENALLYGLKTIEILRKTDKKKELAINLLNIGYDYYVIANYDSALACYNESEPIFKEIEMPIGQAYIIGNRALVYWKKGNYDQAKTDLFQAISMLEPLGDRYGMGDFYNQLANIYLEENVRDKAIAFAMKGLEIATEEGLKEQIGDASYLLYILYQKTGDYKKSNEYQTRYHTYKDSIQNLETTQKLANLRTQFEVGQKQTEVDLLLEQKRNNQIIIITGGIILFIVICLAILLYAYYKSKTRLNKQLKEQKDSLETINQSKDKLFSIISHDLRGPVGVLSGLLFVIKKDLDDIDTVELREMLDQMGHSANHLLKLLDNLLHWSLQQRGHFPYTPETLSLANLLREVTDLFTGMAQSKNIKLDTLVNSDFTVFADKNATSTIFRNLLNNAIKFTPNGGHIQVVAEKNTKASLGTIKFIDNGVGMPKDKLNSLFILNENTSTKGTAGESGLGLGLQLVYDFIKLNNGKIEVESEENKGTTFYVHLPLSSPN